MCADTSQLKHDLYRCQTVAAYANECAQKGIIVNWQSVNDIKDSCDNSNYAKCPGGSYYKDCVNTCNVTCKELTSYDHGKCYSNQCVSGCACPDGQYFDMVYGTWQCVDKSSCTCFDVYTQKFYLPQDKVKRVCSNWFAFIHWLSLFLKPKKFFNLFIAPVPMVNGNVTLLTVVHRMYALEIKFS